MTTYYQALYGTDQTEGVGYADKQDKLFLLPDHGEVVDWRPLRLELRDGVFSDYLASNLGCRMCSKKLKQVLQALASLDDELQWLEVEVRQGADRRPYWILHFPNPPDVLNPDETVFAGKCVVQPVLDRFKVDGHDVFSFPLGGELKLFVSKGVKQAIDAAGCTGLQYSRAVVR